MAPRIRLPARARPLGAGILVLLVAATLAACGEGRKRRPGIVSTFPARGAVLNGGLSLIRIDFDEPVQVLNGDSAQITANGIPIQVDAFQKDGEPMTVYLRPEPQSAYIPGLSHGVLVQPGLVVNADDQYALEAYGFHFLLGNEAPIPAGAPQEVRLFDRETFALLDTVPTPNADSETVVGVLATQSASSTRYWVQRSDPGTGVHNFAYFDTGDAAMTEIPLTLSGMASMLVADAEAIAIGPEGTFLYVAFQELPLMQVRLSKIDVATATEVDSMILSPGADPGTRPRGMKLGASANELAIACGEGADGRLCFVDLDTFTEIDRDGSAPGTQGVSLEDPPLGLALVADRYLMGAEDATGTANTLQVPFATHAGSKLTTAITGTGGLVFATLDRLVALQISSAHEIGFGLVGYSSFVGFHAPSSMAVDDDLGGVAQDSTSIHTGFRFAGRNRFLFVHDNGLLTQWLWTTVNVVQEDLDPLTSGIQGFDGSTNWSDVVTLGQTVGQFPP